ncbi:MAG: L,D-transpeptidase family protein, partial [Planctomycetaceae bacterium]|nr:L,D-transpeptidase family protein [Planctomycetaceae bacterium]
PDAGAAAATAPAESADGEVMVASAPSGNALAAPQLRIPPGSADSGLRPPSSPRHIESPALSMVADAAPVRPAAEAAPLRPNLPASGALPVSAVASTIDTRSGSGGGAAPATNGGEAVTPPVSPQMQQLQLQAAAQQRQLRLEEERARAVSASAATGTSGAVASPVRNDAASQSQPAPAPVLSDAKAQMRAVDQMLSSNPAEAMKRLDDILAMRLEPDDAAEAGYRKGYAARMLRDETAAELAWRETAASYPTLRGGRYSALALADTWYHRFAGDRPQISYWDDIQKMYSLVLGKDDAPFLPDAVKAGIKTKLSRINDMVFFGTAPSGLARYHKVENGELLGSIANKYRVDYESIARINSIDPNRIRAGLDLKLIVGDVEVIVRKNERDPERGPTLTWFLDGRWVREYPACVGDGMKTPAGTYTFTSKDRFPSWTNPANGQLLPNDHPENILGSRWMAMKGMNTQGLGIHGTTVDDSIPGYTSAGCVRLHDKDVEELFSFARIGGKVTILE